MSLADELIKKGVLKNKRLIGAFLVVDRKDFLPENLKEFAYIDEPLPIGEGQTISQPWTVAFMLELLCGSPDALMGRGPDQCVGKNIMEVGYGSGWQTALLAAAGANVYAIELVPELCKWGKSNVAAHFIKWASLAPKGREKSYGTVKFYCQDGSLGLPEITEKIGGFDKIIVAASGKTLPETWQNQLKTGGKIVAPIGHSIFEFIKTSKGTFKEIEHPGFAFVPLISN